MTMRVGRIKVPIFSKIMFRVQRLIFIMTRAVISPVVEAPGTYFERFGSFFTNWMRRTARILKKRVVFLYADPIGTWIGTVLFLSWVILSQRYNLSYQNDIRLDVRVFFGALYYITMAVFLLEVAHKAKKGLKVHRLTGGDFKKFFLDKKNKVWRTQSAFLVGSSSILVFIWWMFNELGLRISSLPSLVTVWLMWFIASRFIRFWCMSNIRVYSPTVLAVHYFYITKLVWSLPKEYYQAQLSDDINSAFKQEDELAPRVAIRLAAHPLWGLWPHCGYKLFMGHRATILTYMSPPESFEIDDLFGKDAKIIPRLMTGMSRVIEKIGGWQVDLSEVSTVGTSSKNPSRFPVELIIYRNDIEEEDEWIVSTASFGRVA